MARCTIIAVNDEEDWELMEGGEALFDESGINLGRNEPITHVCVEGDVVLAALASSLEIEGDPPTSTFSVAVSPTARRAGIARKLITEYMEGVRAQVSEYGAPGLEVVAWVVNPHMVPLLERLGFDSDCAEWSPDCPHFRRWL